MLFFAFFGIIALNNLNYAQTDTTVQYRVTKNNGTQYIGILLKNDAQEVILKTKTLGEVAIPKHMIKSIEKIEGDEVQKDGQVWSRNLMSSRYSLTTNGFPVHKKEGYLKVMPVGVDFQFAITDNWSIGGMTSWYGVPLIITSKYSIEIEPTFHVSAGILYGNLLHGSRIFTGDKAFSLGGGIAFGNMTFGTEERNINISAGYGFVHYPETVYNPETFQYEEDGIFASGTAMFSVAGMYRISEQGVLVFDSMGLIVNGEIYYGINPAIRYMPKPENIWQFGIGVGGNSDFIVPVPIPMISFTKIFIK